MTTPKQFSTHLPVNQMDASGTILSEDLARQWAEALKGSSVTFDGQRVGKVERAEVDEFGLHVSGVLNADKAYCDLHFFDAGELWAWISVPPTIAERVDSCPHCGAMS